MPNKKDQDYVARHAKNILNFKIKVLFFACQFLLDFSQTKRDKTRYGGLPLKDKFLLGSKT